MEKLLNERSELMSKCRHVNKHTLAKYEPEWLHLRNFSSLFRFFPLFTHPSPFLIILLYNAKLYKRD